MKPTYLLFTAVLIALLSLVGCQQPSPPHDTETSVSDTAPVFESAKTEESETAVQESETAAAETIAAETNAPETEPPETDVPETEAPESPCRLLSMTVPKDMNRNMCEDITAIIEDNAVTLTVTAPTDTFSLRKAAVDCTTDGISVTFSTAQGETVDLLAPHCTCTVTDENGLTRTYSVTVVHAEHTIPVIAIDTASGLDIVSKEEYVTATVSIDTTGVDDWYLPEGFCSLAPTAVQIRGRGNSTWNWEKKPYKLKFAEKTEILGMEAAKKWILLSNYADYSLIRNFVAMETTKVLSTELCPLSQYPVNLFLNGEYQGVYTIGEDHEVKSARIDLEKDNGTPDTSFLLEIGGYEDEDVWGTTAFTAGLVRYCSIEYPEESLTTEQAAFIRDYCQKADEAVRTLNGYEDYIDLDSLIDWFLSTELFYNLESCFRRSCFMTKEPGGKLQMGPVWDYDLAMGNLYNDFGQYNQWAHLTQANGYIEDNWYCYLLNDPAFLARLTERWNEVKDSLLSTALNCIDTMADTLSVSAEYNFERWNILGTRAVPPQPWSITGLATYADNIAYIRKFIVDRWNWIDGQIGF